MMMALGLGAAMGGCSDPTGTQAVLVPTVRLDDLLYSPRAELHTQAETQFLPSEGSIRGAAFATPVAPAPAARGDR